MSGPRHYQHQKPQPTPVENPLLKRDYGDYFNATHHLKPEYVDEWANSLAQLFGLRRLNKHQMRAFLNQVKRLQTRYRAKRDFEETANGLHILKATAFNRNKRSSSVPDIFREFIEKNVDKAVRDPDSFAAFVQHFEAVAAYCEGRLARE